MSTPSTPHRPNALTDQLGFITRHPVHGRNFLARLRQQPLSRADGFSLEHYRGEQDLGSIHPFSNRQGKNTEPRMKEGDTIWWVNLGPAELRIKGELLTEDGYKRPYEVTVELRAGSPQLLVRRYRQFADPARLIKLAIEEALQQYASRTKYAHIKSENLQFEVEQVSNHNPLMDDLQNVRVLPNFQSYRQRIIAGLVAVRAYHPVLEADKGIKPVNFHPSPLVITGQLETRDHYLRGYEITIHLTVIDRDLFATLSRKGEPLADAKTLLQGTLDRYASQFNNQALNSLGMVELVDQAFSSPESREHFGMRMQFVSGKLYLDHIAVLERDHTLTLKEIELTAAAQKMKDEHTSQAKSVFADYQRSEDAKQRIYERTQRVLDTAVEQGMGTPEWQLGSLTSRMNSPNQALSQLLLTQMFGSVPEEHSSSQQGSTAQSNKKGGPGSGTSNQPDTNNQGSGSSKGPGAP